MSCLPLHDDGLVGGKKIIGEMELDIAGLIIGNGFALYLQLFFDPLNYAFKIVDKCRLKSLS